MTIPVFITPYGYSVRKKPTFATIVRAPKSGRDVTFAQQKVPLWEFELVCEVLRDQTQNVNPDLYFSGYQDYMILIEQFTAFAAGQYGWFFFEDTSDNSRKGQVLGKGNGTTTEYLFLRSISYGAIFWTEAVGAVNNNHTVHVYLDAVELPELGNWSISADGTTLIFNTAPGSGVEITVDFYYYYCCRFITDDLLTTEFLTDRWEVKSLRFRSVRNNPLPLPSWVPLGLPA